MSTTKNKITEAEISNKILEAQVDLSQSFLNENNEIRKRFDYEKKIIKYEISPLVPDNIITELKQILETSSSKDLIHLNPVIVALAELQNLKNLKYDKENSKSIEDFKLAKKTIIAFGKGITDAKKILKEPHLAYNKKIDSIYNLFDTEKDTVKNCLEENFKEYIQEEEEKKKKAEENKKKAELEKIAELSKQNEELIAQAAKSEKNKIYLQYESSIAKILTDTTVNVLNLNKEALSKLLDKFSNISFEKVLKEEHKSIFDETQILKLSQDFSNNIETSKKIISDKIKSILDSENLKDVQAQNKILEAQTPKIMDSPENNPSLSPELPKVESESNIAADGVIPPNDVITTDGFTDAQLFEILILDLKALHTKVNSVTEKIKSYNFSNNNISQLRNIITDQSLPKIDEWCEKLIKWSEEKNVLIKQIK